MPHQQLPLWVSYLQALAVPVIAIVGAWIAALQMLIAYDKLQQEAFERRYERRIAVYEATRKFLADVFHGNVSENEIRAYGLHTLDAQFLFDDALYRYLRELCYRVTAWRAAKSSAENLPSSHERAEFERIGTDHLNWVIQQGDEQTGFAVKFRPFLLYSQVKRPWFLHWPFRI